MDSIHWIEVASGHIQFCFLIQFDGSLWILNSFQEIKTIWFIDQHWFGGGDGAISQCLIYFLYNWICRPQMGMRNSDARICYAGYSAIIMNFIEWNCFDLISFDLIELNNKSAWICWLHTTIKYALARLPFWVFLIWKLKPYQMQRCDIFQYLPGIIFRLNFFLSFFYSMSLPIVSVDFATFMIVSWRIYSRNDSIDRDIDSCIVRFYAEDSYGIESIDGKTEFDFVVLKIHVTTFAERHRASKTINVRTNCFRSLTANL